MSMDSKLRMPFKAQERNKLRQAMVRPGRERLRGVVEVDETYWGTMESDGATGRRVLNKAMIIVAAEAHGRGIGRIRMARIPDFDRKTLHGFIRESVKAGSTICTDGLNSYRELEGYVHDRKVQRHQPEGDKLLPRVHLAVSLLKRWMLGTTREALLTSILMIISTSSSSASTGENLPHAASCFIGLLSSPSKSSP